MVLPLTYDNSNQRSVSRVNIMQQQLVLLLLNFISAMPRKAYFSRLRLCNYAYKFGRFFKQCSLLIDSFFITESEIGKPCSSIRGRIKFEKGKHYYLEAEVYLLEYIISRMCPYNESVYKFRHVCSGGGYGCEWYAAGDHTVALTAR